MGKNKLKSIGVGEILWDLFPEGKKLGGAPTNFAFIAGQLGIESAIISATGKDDLGKEIQSVIDQSEIINFITENDKPTGTVTVQIDPVGVPTYIIHENVAWDHIELSAKAEEYASGVNAVCFGSLAQRSGQSGQTIRKILDLVPAEAIRVFDINLRQLFYSKEIIEQSLEKANVLKINDEEIVKLTDMLGINGDEFGMVDQILKKFDLNYLALTKGDKGSWLISKEEKSFIETPQVKVVDTVGAGDSFAAAMVAGLLHKKPLEEVHRLAVDVSAYVCTQEGATPSLPDDLKELV